jgi:hypothetical protein
MEDIKQTVNDEHHKKLHSITHVCGTRYVPLYLWTSLKSSDTKYNPQSAVLSEASIPLYPTIYLRGRSNRRGNSASYITNQHAHHLSTRQANLRKPGKLPVGAGGAPPLGKPPDGNGGAPPGKPPVGNGGAPDGKPGKPPVGNGGAPLGKPGKPPVGNGGAPDGKPGGPPVGNGGAPLGKPGKGPVGAGGMPTGLDA